MGLVLALDLATRGIRSTLVERDAGTALELLAKAGTLNERTMEYYRRLGIAMARLYERRLVLVRPDGMVAWGGDALPADVAALIATATGNVKP